MNSTMLSPDFRQLIEYDQFVEVGWFGFVEGQDAYNRKVHIDTDASNWTLCVYSHVSFADGGKHIRIGKAERKLKERLSAWPYHICGALNNDMIATNKRFAGSTPPWEAQGWLDYLADQGGRGLLFAMRGPDRGSLSATELEHAKRQLRSKEKELILRYQAPLNNDRYSRAGKARMEAWVAEYGPPTKIWRRSPPAPLASRT